MSDASSSSTPADALRADTGNVNRDRADLADLPPAQIDDDAVQANTEDGADGPGDSADAARA